MTMAKKKEVLASTEVPDTGLLNPKVHVVQTTQPTQEVKEVEPEIVINEMDFNELLDMERALRQTEEQFNKIAGTIKRLEKDLDVYNNNERALTAQIDSKRKDFVKLYRLDEQRPWKIDINTRKIVYQ
jgi:hypothetical protein